MILRRVIEHVKAQNWFAVFLDFVIVVVGVFVGLQVNNWNAARLERARGAVYSERLKTELKAELEYSLALLHYYETTREAGRVAYLGLSGREELDDEVTLINAYRASQYNWYERRRAAFDEIVASGSLSLISDASLRETAIGVYSTALYSLMEEEGQNSLYRELFRMTVEPQVQDDLFRNCGDKEYEAGGVAVGLLRIDYECALTTSASETADAVAALRGDPEILKALRLRNAQVANRIADIELTLRALGLRALFKEAAAP
jgi:hypothetical protein